MTRSLYFSILSNILILIQKSLTFLIYNNYIIFLPFPFLRCFSILDDGFNLIQVKDAGGHALDLQVRFTGPLSFTDISSFQSIIFGFAEIIDVCRHQYFCTVLVGLNLPTRASKGDRCTEIG